MARRGWRSAAAVLAVGLIAASACSDDDTDAAPSTSVAPTTSAASSARRRRTSSASTSSAPTSSAPTSSVPDESSTGPAELTAAIDKIEGKSQYESTDWGYIAIDQKTGEVLASQNPDKMFDPGSTMKGFSVSAALDAYGPDHTFVTPLYKAGTVSGDTLDGNLVLVGAGDLSFGLRAEPTGPCTTRTSRRSTTATRTSAPPVLSSRRAIRSACSTSSPSRSRRPASPS